MVCKACLERRRAIMEAWQEKKIAEAVRLAAGGLRDMVKDKGGCRHEFMRQELNEYGRHEYNCPECRVSGTRDTPLMDGEP